MFYLMMHCTQQILVTVMWCWTYEKLAREEIYWCHWTSSGCSTVNTIKSNGYFGMEGRTFFLFNNKLNTFYLWLYGIRHIVKDHSNTDRKPTTTTTWCTLSKGSFICTIPERIAHTMAFVIPLVEHWLKWEIAQWVHHNGWIQCPITP